MMRDILITSSALILALLLLRRVFQNVLSRRVQYGLWALVLVRLLVPINLLPPTDFSVITVAAPVTQAVAQQVNQPFYFRPVTQVSPEELEQKDLSVMEIPTAQEGAVMVESRGPGYSPDGYLVRDPETNTVTRYAAMTVGPWEILERIWKVGMVGMALFFLSSNLLFWRKLRRVRREFTPEDGPARKIYLVPDGVLPSPCLFGRSIYLTPAAIETPEKLRHVLAHEETHARHWDPLWSLLRCLCLTVYWFDPLVWIAAACSKTDCELACDESVLNTLGEDERIPYGQTLLSLVPVRKGPANPMIAATTMTAGKRQLKDRITRIAKGPRQVMAAVLAVALLVMVTAACTFTDGWYGEAETGPSSPSPAESQPPEDGALRPLTGEELEWFNEKFFNGPEQDEYGYSGYNICNQFANPINLYDKPENIDLYELFYLEGTAPSDEELKAVFDSTWDDLPCAAYKLTSQEINTILEHYTGLTLDNANKQSLTYVYLPDYDAYYWMHGDTNYCGDLQFTVGTREGNTYKLYHNSSFAGNNWYCVTLERQGEGLYRFVSNRECEKPAIPTPLPAWDPAAVVSLKDLAPYTAPAVTMEHRPESDFPGGYENQLANWNFDGHSVTAYRAADGKVRAAVKREDGSFDVFLTMEDGEYQSMFFFDDLFGHNGFYVHYHGATPGDYYKGGEGSSYGSIYEYFYFGDQGVLTRLLRCPFPAPVQVDLNGDGSDELIFHNGFFFQREGLVYRADLKELLRDACPEPETWDYAAWVQYGKYFDLRGYTEDYKEFTRYLYFDGENLLVYKNEFTVTDHLAHGITAGVPDIVVEKAKESARSAFVEVDGVYRDAHYQEEGYPQEAYDDWCVSGFYGPYTKTLGGVTIQGWSFGIGCHTTEPEKVVLAGSRSLSEDNWTSPGAWGTPNIVFLRQEADGSLTYLWTGFDDGTLDSYGGTEGLLLDMEQHGVELAEGYTYPELHFQMRLEWISSTYYDYQKSESGEMRIQYNDGQGNGETYIVDPSEGNGAYYLNQMKDNYVIWSRAEGDLTAPKGPTVIFSDPYWNSVLQFWKDSGLVMYKEQNREPEWYEVKYDGDPSQDVFAYRAYPYYWARCWFDDAEAGKYSNTALGDHGNGDYREVASAYLALYEEASKRNATPGSQYACTYVKVTNVEIEKQQPEGWFPQETKGYERFAFSYNVIFVPENEGALHTLMPGNTGSYEGNDPDVPKGAFEYSRVGSMYLKDGYWHCAGIGTG